ncbi:MAG: M28 family peptidase [Bacteroidota bacterium]|nr:M28 family peptidase [Bacteroidota bacterium]
MKIFPSLLAIGSVLFCCAQKKTDPVIFGNSIRAENLQKHLYRIAGPEFEGRETATPGQRKAASYIEEYFKTLGLKPGNKDSFQLSYPVYKDSLLSAEIDINGESFMLNKDFDIRLAAAHTVSLGVSEIVFAGYGFSDSLRNDYEGLNVSGKIVLVLNGYPPGILRTHINNKSFNAFAKQDAAQQHGALAVFIIQEDFPHKALADPGKMYRKYFLPAIRPNSFYISDRMGRALMGKDYDQAIAGSIKTKTYSAEIWQSLIKETRFLQSTDVLGYLEGSDLRDQLLVISAHYDHLGRKDSVIYFGADDDGSGTVSLLEMAAAFSKAKAAGKGPRRSILFLANSGEEKGLWGSEYYTDHPAYPLDQTTADLNIDMIGRRDPARKQGDSNNYIYIVGDDKLSTDLHPISVDMNKKYTGLELDYKFNNPKDPLRIYYRSDHFNFARKGVPIIFYFDGINADYHKPTDTPDKINYDLMAKRVQLVFYTAWEMANRNEMLKRDLPPVTGER